MSLSAIKNNKKKLFKNYLNDFLLYRTPTQIILISLSHENSFYYELFITHKDNSHIKYINTFNN